MTFSMDLVNYIFQMVNYIIRENGIIIKKMVMVFNIIKTEICNIKVFG